MIPRLRVPDIPDEGLSLAVKSSADPWFTKLLEEVFGEKFRKKERAALNLDVLKTADNVRLAGEIQVKLHPTCDRCLEPFERKLLIPIDTNLAPLKEMNVMEGESELTSEDINFSSYKGEEINLVIVLREPLLLEIPLRYLCEESCKGLCPKCGKNLNTGKCQCPPAAKGSRFAILKDALKELPKKDLLKP